jgi:cysteinyl-tRNA synthetase
MDDDLNTPAALAAIFAFARKVNTLIDSGSMGKKGASEALAVLKTVNAVLGVLEEEKEELSEDEAALLTKREDARKRRDFGESDRLREELLMKGVVVEDTPTGTRWRRRSQG